MVQPAQVVVLLGPQPKVVVSKDSLDAVSFGDVSSIRQIPLLEGGPVTPTMEHSVVVEMSWSPPPLVIEAVDFLLYSLLRDVDGTFSSSVATILSATASLNVITR